MDDQTERDDDSREIERISARIEKQDLQIRRLRNTLKGIAKEIDGLSVNGQCDNCGQSMLLVRNGQIFCPHCKDGKTL